MVEIVGTMEGLKASGIKHVAFKPGPMDGVRQVINIAVTNLDFPIIMQWTGGRAAGHHSFDDFQQPVTPTCRAIWQHANVCHIGGSGFGSADDVLGAKVWCPANAFLRFLVSFHCFRHWSIQPRLHGSRHGKS